MKIIKKLAGIAGVLLILLALFIFFPTRPNGFYNTSAYSCLCGPTLLEFRDDEVYAYSEGHMTGDFFCKLIEKDSDYYFHELFGGKDILISSFNGFLKFDEVFLDDFRTAYAYRVYLSDEEKARVRAYPPEEKVENEEGGAG